MIYYFKSNIQLSISNVNYFLLFLNTEKRNLAEEDNGDEPETHEEDEEEEAQEEQEQGNVQEDETSEEDEEIEGQEEQEELQEDEQGLEGCLNEAGNNIHNSTEKQLYFL